MIRLLVYLLAILALAAGLHWLADRPGTITIEWLQPGETSSRKLVTINRINGTT